MAKHKANYVDGFVIVISKKNFKMYREMAQFGKKLWTKHGALDYKESCGDDLVTKSTGGMKPLSFTKLTKAKSNEMIWFSFITFKSKKHRDQVNAKVMKDPIINDPKWKDKPMPFDMQHMAYGGFKVIVSN